MVLKEAFRNQNFLDNLLDKGLNYVNRTANVTTTTQNHLRKKANPDADDETIIVQKFVTFDNDKIDPNVIVDFMLDVLAEKEKLTKAIAYAKSQVDLDIDAAIALNKKKQLVANALKSMSNIKSSERITQDRAYKFNAEGVQVPYTYDVKEVTSIDFDRNKVKALSKKLMLETDEVSNKIDSLNVTAYVDYVSKYDIGDSFEDCLNTFLDGFAE